ncbi:MAG TPA: glycosyltransferase [Pseudonocardia sp.]|nr:glycosyltransferase [Pseudonocardia sp.]
MFFVATPSRNYGRFLADALVSVRDQSVRDRSACDRPGDRPGARVRHHVQDALSDDETAEVLAAHAWPGLTVARERDRGQCDALNRAFAQAPGDAEYLGWLNADEFYLPGAFDAVRAAFERHPGVDVVYGDCLHVDEAGRLRRLVAQHPYSATVLRSMRHLYIQTSSTFFRRRVLDAGELRLDERYRQAMDHELFVRLAARGHRFHHLPVPLSAFRVHGEQLTARHGASVAAREHRAVQDQFGYRARPWAGRAVHRARKLAGGAYVREVRAWRDRGRPVRWFDPGTTADVTARLARLGAGA